MNFQIDLFYSLYCERLTVTLISVVAPLLTDILFARQNPNRIHMKKKAHKKNYQSNSYNKI